MENQTVQRLRSDENRPNPMKWQPVSFTESSAADQAFSGVTK